MTTVLSRKKTALALASVFQVLEVLNRYDVTDTSAQALIIAATRTLDEHPRPVTPSEVAKALSMTVSAVARLLAKLADEDGAALLTSDRAIPGSRAEAYVLTKKGRVFAAALLSAFEGHSVELPVTHTLKTFAKQLDTFAAPTLRKVKWDDESLTLIVSPAEAFLSDEIQEWVNEFLSEPPTVQGLTKEGVPLKFANITDAVYFTLRWC